MQRTKARVNSLYLMRTVILPVRRIDLTTSQVIIWVPCRRCDYYRAKSQVFTGAISPYRIWIYAMYEAIDMMG